MLRMDYSTNSLKKIKKMKNQDYAKSRDAVISLGKVQDTSHYKRYRCFLTKITVGSIVAGQ